MRTFSYAIDVFVFFVMLYLFDTSWLLAFIVSWLVGAAIRAIFVAPEAPVTKTVSTIPEGSEAGPAESAD
jgi:hypothetical protein